MREDIRTEWVNALRSGEYRQVSGALCKVDPDTGEKRGHCCLGVLSEIAANHGVIPGGELQRLRDIDAEVYDEGSGFYEDLRYAGQDSHLPDEVVEWAGLDDEDPRFRIEPEDDEIVWSDDGKIGYSLAEINDNGKSFKDIADIIEKHF